MTCWAFIELGGRIGMAGDSKDLPSGAVWLPDHIGLLDTGRWALIDGVWTDVGLVPDPVVPPEVIAAERLAAARRDGIDLINTEAGRLRSLFLTDIPGQQLVYQDKEREAVRYMAEVDAAATPDLTTYHWLPKEVGITAPTAYEIVQIWLNMAALWRWIGPLIEEVRLATIAQIEGTSDLLIIEAATTAGLAALEALRAAAAGAAP